MWPFEKPPPVEYRKRVIYATGFACVDLHCGTHADVCETCGADVKPCVFSKSQTFVSWFGWMDDDWKFSRWR